MAPLQPSKGCDAGPIPPISPPNSVARARRDATEGAKLPEEVLQEILARLPPKSLSRFRFVCKSWYNLIKEPFFHAKHTQIARAINNCLLLWRKSRVIISPRPCLLRDEEKGKPKLVDIPLRSGVDLLGCANGVFCMKDSYDSIFLWNFATGEVRFSPYSKKPTSFPKDKFVGVFNAFGYDTRNDEFKVVQIWFCDRRSARRPYFYSFEVRVWSVSSDTWRKIDAVPPALMSELRDSDHFYLDGKYYWRRAFHRVDMLLFDFSDEVFKLIKWPKEAVVERRMYDHDQHVVVLNGTAALVTYRFMKQEGATMTRLKIWFMKDSGEWSNRRMLDIPLDCSRILGTWKDGKWLVSDCKQKIFSYNLGTEKARLLPVKLDEFKPVLVFRENWGACLSLCSARANTTVQLQ